MGITSNIRRVRRDLFREINRDLLTIFRQERVFAATELYDELVERAPVDTGLFAGNWQFFARTLRDRTLRRLNPDRNRLPQEINKILRSSPRSTLFLVNNLDYAQRLEEGASGQAPQGFIELALAELRTAMRMRNVQVIIR